jgi:hypothetical protein
LSAITGAATPHECVPQRGISVGDDHWEQGGAGKDCLFPVNGWISVDITSVVEANNAAFMAHGRAGPANPCQQRLILLTILSMSFPYQPYPGA